MSSLLDDIGKNVKTNREVRGLSQQELADLSGLHRNYIIEVEKGRRNITIESLNKIAQSLNTDIERLVKSDSF